MTRDEIRQWTRREPFQPFWLGRVNGDRYAIFWPDMLMTGTTQLVVGIPLVNAPHAAAERVEFIALSEIASIEPIADS